MFDLSKLFLWRTRKKLTQAELSKRSDITIQTISRIENGQCKNVDTKTIEKLAKGLGVQPATFLKK